MNNEGKKLLERVENLVSMIKTDIQYADDRDEIYDETRLLTNITKFIEYNTPDLKHYGIDNLVERLDYVKDEIKNENITDLGDIVDVVFEFSRMDGTLTFSTYQAEREIYANYSLDEIIEKMQENPMKNTEQFHILLAEEKFYENLEEIYENLEFNENLDEKEKLTLFVYEVLKENGVELNKEDEIEYKNLLEKDEMENFWYSKNDDKNFER